MHEDSELCFELMRESDFGWVQQVLSFMRLHEQSILGGVSTYDWRALDAYLTLRLYGAEFLGEDFPRRMGYFRTQYLACLGEAALFLREKGYWAYHRRGLATIGERLRPLVILPYVGRALVKALLRPGWALRQLQARLRLR
jgi:hypothetical protein